jgi:hypothetical protein
MYTQFMKQHTAETGKVLTAANVTTATLHSKMILFIQKL